MFIAKKEKKTFANKIHLHNSNSSDHQWVMLAYILTSSSFIGVYTHELYLCTNDYYELLTYQVRLYIYIPITI
jgi:hypothetical protein